jgi:2-haloacid dehalogenase
VDRWATFDCYGTLIDWNGGILRELERLWGPDRAGRLLHRYHELEPEVQRQDSKQPYRQILNMTLDRLARDTGLDLPADEGDALSRSLPTWAPFPEVRAALEATRERGWKLAILSNTDRDFIDASVAQIGVPFELEIVAGEIGSYKPSPWHWEVFLGRSDADRDHHVHVAASLFHDIAPATALGIPTVWINRLGEEPEPQPTRELHDLSALPETLDELVPAAD